MKKWFLIVGGSLALLCAGAAVFALNFNLDRYRPVLARKIEQAAGGPVRLGRLSVGWHRGLAVELNGFWVLRGGQASDKAVLSADKITATLNLLPLLHKRLEVTSLVIVRPQAQVTRAADGSLTGERFAAVPGKGSLATGSRLSAGATFNIDAVEIRDGEFRFVDKFRSPPVKMTLRQVDCVIRQVPNSDAADLQLKLAVFGTKQNLKAKGRVTLTEPRGSFRIDDLVSVVQLDLVDAKELNVALPQWADAGIREGLKGQLTMRVGKWVQSGPSPAQLEGGLVLKDGRLFLRYFQVPLEGLFLEADGSLDQLELKNFSAGLAGGRVALTGRLKDYLSPSPRMTLKGQVSGLDLEQLSGGPKEPGLPYLAGKFSSSFDGETSGLTWPLISRTLGGSGKVSLSDGVVKNLNLFYLVAQKLSRVPGVEDALRHALPPEYQQKLSQRDTRLAPIAFDVSVANGALVMKNLHLSTDTFDVFGSGQVGLNGAVAITATLAMEPRLSSILIRNASALQYLADPYGRISIPIRVEGTVGHLRVQPDVDYITSRVVAAKSEQLIGGLLQKVIKAPGAAASSAEEAVSGNGSYQKLLGSLFQ